MSMKNREQLIAEMRRLRDEIQQMFDDARHWNNNVRKPHEQVIDPDPFGKLKRMKDALDASLAREEATK